MELKDYYEAASLEEVNAEYAKPDRIILAGGTNLMVKGKGKNWYQKTTFLSVSRIEALRQVERRGDRIVIGAAVTLTELLQNPLVAEGLPLLVQAVSRIGNRQIRNRATLAGNLANACPAADGIQALMVLDTEVEISSSGGSRMVPLEGLYRECAACLRHEGMQVSTCFYANPCEKKLNLGKGEWITRVIVRVQQTTEASHFYKLTDNQSSNLAIVNLAMTIEAGAGEGEYRVKAAVGGMFPKPKRFLWEGEIEAIRKQYGADLEREMRSAEASLVDFWYKKQVIFEKIEELLTDL